MNDGLVTATPSDIKLPLPTYASAGRTRVPANFSDQTQVINSFYDSHDPTIAISLNQLSSANKILDTAIKIVPNLYSTPPYLADMFALIPLKLAGLKPGQTYFESGGSIQENTRKYFGPVNITRVNIQLVNDHGDVINLNGGDWTFSIICEYLYNVTRE